MTGAAGLLLIASMISPLHAVTLSTGDALGTSSFNTAGNWSDGQAPHAGAAYLVSVNFLRTPADSNNHTFAGDSLTITSGGGMIYKGTATNTYTINPLILDGGLVRSGAGSTQRMILDGTISVTTTSGSEIRADQNPFTISSDLSGPGNLLLSGSYATTFTGTSTLTGNIIVAGTLLQDAAGSIGFTIGANGVNNAVSGTGSATFDGAFAFDLSGAGTTVGNSWMVADVTNQSFGSTFSVSGFYRVGTGTGPGVWELDNGGTYYSFDTATGVLQVVSSLSSTDLTLDNESYTSNLLGGFTVTMTGHSELHITGAADPIPSTTIHLNSEDSWVFFHHTTVPPSYAASTLLSRIQVNGSPAVLGTNVRVVAYGEGSVVIPQSSTYQPLTVYTGENFGGSSTKLDQYTAYDATLLDSFNDGIRSFTLKRGYTATFAQNADGTGISKNYVAQDSDLEIGVMAAGLDQSVSFVRVFPWRWSKKKGIAGSIGQQLDVGWYYNWNIDQASSLDREYVAIRQTRWWPGLSQDWKARGVNTLLGYNEPDNSVEANMTVGDAIYSWPDLLSTGLRVGSPAPTDGGLSWLYSFMDQAALNNLRVDFVAVHYYRCFDPTNPSGAASQMYNFLKGIHDRTGKPIWITEWNNGANWTGCADPTYEQQAACIDAMTQMLENTPFVERYAPYNWVEDVRRLQWEDGWPTSAGFVYRDIPSKIGYLQEVPDSGKAAPAKFLFEGNFRDTSGNGNNPLVYGTPKMVVGQGVSSALSLDGTDDYLQLPPKVAQAADFTFATWVKWDGGSSWQRILDCGAGTTQYMYLSPDVGGNLRFAITTGSGEQQLNGTALTPGVWTHVAVTLNGNTGTLYVNGSAVASGSITLNPANLAATRCYLGKSQFSADPLYDGLIDDAYIFDRALSGSEVAALASVPDSNAPAAPASLAATTGSGQVHLDWADNTETDLLGYDVYRSTTSGSGYVLIATHVPGSGYTDTAVVDETTYYYIVTATDTSGNVSAGSGEVSATPVDVIAPSVPAGLVAIPGDSAVNLDWADNTESDFAGYTVYRSTTSGSGFAPVASGISNSAWTDSTVVNGTTYYYVVTASDLSSNESAFSNEDSATPRPPSLIAHYPFEGGTTDSSVYGHDATATGAPSYGAGQDGQAISLDGVDDHVTAPAAIADGADITLAAWINWNGGSAWQRIFDFGDDTSHYLFLTPSSGSGTLRFGIKNGGSEQQLNANALTPGVWTHVAVTLNGDTGTLYVNGAAAATNAAMTINPGDFSPILNYIGKSQWPDPLFSGLIDDFRVYNYALTGADIATLASGGSGDTTPPAAPSGLAATAGDGSVAFDWADSGEPDLASYTVYRSTTSGSGYASIASGLATSAYTDSSAINGTTYYYVVTATDTSANESAFSGEVSATPQAAPSNSAPQFASSLLTKANATEASAYSGSIAGDASDPDAGDTLTFAKLGGPAWLSVAGDGTLGGTPGSADVGTNQWTVEVSDTGGLSDTATLQITVDALPGAATYGATGETTASGTIVSGSYASTLTSDNDYEQLRETESGGKPSNRYSYLEHTWSFDIGAGGSEVMLSVEAHHSANSEGDDFVFAWSADGTNYTNAVTVTKTADDNTPQTVALPAGLSGPIQIRVTDANRSSGNRQLDSLYVDGLGIEVTP